MILINKNITNNYTFVNNTKQITMSGVEVAVLGLGLIGYRVASAKKGICPVCRCTQRVYRDNAWRGKPKSGERCVCSGCKSHFTYVGNGCSLR